VIASLPRDSSQFSDCAIAGADVVSVTPALLHALLVHPLTDRGVDLFLNELSRHARPRVAT
jgi:transaldolase